MTIAGVEVKVPGPTSVCPVHERSTWECQEAYVKRENEDVDRCLIESVHFP